MQGNQTPAEELLGSNNPQYDLAAKNILSEKPVAAYLLKGVVPEFKNASLKDIDQVQSAVMRAKAKGNHCRRIHYVPSLRIGENLNKNFVVQFGNRKHDICSVSRGAHIRREICNEIFPVLVIICI